MQLGGKLLNSKANQKRQKCQVKADQQRDQVKTDRQRGQVNTD
jgi:hypothetical protein